jgi:hypothetical protein
MSLEEADALGRAWLENRVAPEDFDPRIKEWRSEQAVNQAVKDGDVSVKQRQEEIERRRRVSTQFGIITPQFVDKYPIVGYGQVPKDKVDEALIVKDDEDA